MPRTAYAEVIALCCAACVPAMSHFDRQYGCNLRGSEHEEDRERPINEENKTDEYIAVHAYKAVHNIRLGGLSGSKAPPTTSMHETIMTPFPPLSQPD